MKHLKNLKPTNSGLQLSLHQLETIKKKGRNTNTCVSVLKFVGDTIPGSLVSFEVKMKMDLRLTCTHNFNLQNHGYGEIAKKVSKLKYLKDKRKTVVASKALLNSIMSMNTNQEKDGVYIPYLIGMGFDIYLCIVCLVSNKFYITKKIKTISFPSSLSNFSKELINVANGLLDLVALCETIKKQAFRGKKRNCIDSCINNIIESEKERGTSKVAWDNVEEDELESEVDGDEDDNDDEGNSD
ncbi:hypothetical protein G6F57_006749 [Rhizopus arrhizus]|nr:hypothetical protein G6F30_007769 [Rhizopus arrhizus]KAG0977789.1 hypothetical protein G6F28_012308 [Rhizopus arrhizus]KAG0983547.1 hypothetical protein G6F29_005443 [Rhizopus arrhizus]KAG1010986.1 hypothetical protein G6F27_004143 [Rhizopus arrhizus]KAG1022010.1 hypothetical protein G6F26_007985 [Rhizopus arrhizus]